MFMKFNMLTDCIKVFKPECSSLPPVTVRYASNIETRGVQHMLKYKQKAQELELIAIPELFVVLQKWKVQTSCFLAHQFLS